MKDINLNDVFFFQIERMMRAVKDYTLSEFKKHKFQVTKDQWVILKRISEVDGNNQKEIADSTFKDPAALTRILDLLEKKGLVKRETDSSDRRTFTVHLTVEGSRLVARMTPIVQNIRSKALKGISKNEEHQMKEVMKKIVSNF